MKKFLSGVLCATLVFSLALSALAISSKMTIDVDPINIQVNGQTFAPTDVNGKEVPVFAYEGTTYAPLRALAEAYGLEVGYDQAANMATVTDPEAQSASASTPDTNAKLDYSDWSADEEAEYLEFKAMWELVEAKPRDTNPSEMFYKFSCLRDISDEALDELRTEKADYIERMGLEYAAKDGIVLTDGNGILLCLLNATSGYHFYISRS